jgi:hypothetical protein
MKQKKKPGLAEYLIEHAPDGDAAAIEALKQRWKREYKAKWRKEKRMKDKEFTVSFSPVQLSTIQTAARCHHRSITAYIKDASLAYTKNEYLVIDEKGLNDIKELLTLTYTSLRDLSGGGTEDIHHNQLLKRLERLETAILTILENPTLLAELLKETPSYSQIETPEQN